MHWNKNLLYRHIALALGTLALTACGGGSSGSDDSSSNTTSQT